MGRFEMKVLQLLEACPAIPQVRPWEGEHHEVPSLVALAALAAASQGARRKKAFPEDPADAFREDQADAFPGVQADAFREDPADAFPGVQAGACQEVRVDAWQEHHMEQTFLEYQGAFHVVHLEACQEDQEGAPQGGPAVAFLADRVVELQGLEKPPGVPLNTEERTP